MTKWNTVIDLDLKILEIQPNCIQNFVKHTGLLGLCPILLKQVCGYHLSKQAHCRQQCYIFAYDKWVPNTLLSIYSYTYAPFSVDILKHTHTHAHAHTHIHTHIHTHKYTKRNIYIYIYIHTHAYIYIYIYIDIIYTYIYIHIILPC